MSRAPDDGVRATPSPGGARPEESLLRGGLTGIALVTLATVGLACAAAIVALIVSLLYR